jgi:hypothetical protein
MPSTGHENFTNSPVFGDIDGDGYTDMVVFNVWNGACTGPGVCSTSTGDSNVYVGYGNAEGTFTYSALP